MVFKKSCFFILTYIDIIYMIPNMTFEWNEVKNRKNRQTHGIWFEEAQMIFSDSYHRVFLDKKTFYR